MKAKKALFEVSGIGASASLIEPDEKEYNSNWIWAKKIEFAIKDGGVPTTSNEIVDKLLIYEPTLDRKKAIASVSSNLSVKSGMPQDGKQFIKIDDGTGVNKYFIDRPISAIVQHLETCLPDNKKEDEVSDLPF